MLLNLQRLKSLGDMKSPICEHFRFVFASLDHLTTEGGGSKGVLNECNNHELYHL